MESVQETIYIMLNGHERTNEVQTTVQIFFPNMHYKSTDVVMDNATTVESFLHDGIVGVRVYEKAMKVLDETMVLTDYSDLHHMIRLVIYTAMKKRYGGTQPWGMMTGIRPAKVINELIKGGCTPIEAKNVLINRFFVDREKADLALSVALAEEAVLMRNDKDAISLYIGIPFCPTRCLYCSFTSYPLQKYIGKVDAYLDALIKELEFLGEYTKNRVISTVYIGGGTPTTLSAIQMERLFQSIYEHFDMSHVLEFTVEAGRPDTITAEKLRLMKKWKTDRISINPQTMNDRTLQLMGRKHSVADVKEAFKMAREAGHENINMDLILGLPGEDAEDVRHTMEEIGHLSPENLTVHTLAVKRASRLREDMEMYIMTDPSVMEEMLEIAAKGTHDMGLSPYYMYRQKNMVGSFENVGYSKAGYEGIYNVEIMEERQTILAAGAGASTKCVDMSTNHIKRIFNVKSVDDYIERIDEMIERKRRGLQEGIKNAY